MKIVSVTTVEALTDVAAGLAEISIGDDGREYLHVPARQRRYQHRVVKAMLDHDEIEPWGLSLRITAKGQRALRLRARP